MSKSRRTSDLVNSLLVNADNSVNIHEGTQSPYFQLDTLATPTLQPGMFGWNDVDGTADLRLKGGNVTLQLGQETVARVVNKTGANLLESEYKVVRVRIASEGGAQGQRLAVVLAQGNNDPDSVTTLGIVTENIDNNQEGFITVFGNVSEINTTGSLQGETWVDGDVLFLSPTTPGALTKVKPTAPNHTVIMGYVVYAHAVHGKIFVKVDNGYELEELHDVLPTPYVNNGVLYRDTTANLWKSATIATLLGGSPIISMPTLAQVTTAGNTTTNAITVGGLTVATNLIYTDTVNGRVGIGSTSPLVKLYVEGTNVTYIGVKSTTNSGASSYIAYNDLGNSYEFGMWGSTRAAYGVINSGNAYLYGSVDLAVVSLGNLKFSASNIATERMRIVSASGNVLINTTTDAGYKLQVVGNIALSGNLVPTGGSQSLGTFTNRFGDLWAGGLIVGTTFYGDNLQSASGNLYFKEGSGLEKMRMLANGNFLIGTTTDAGYKLDVSGTLRSTADTYFATASGNVGVGTVSPQYKFDVRATSVKVQIRSTAESENATLFLGTPFNTSALPKVAIIAKAQSSWSRADLYFCVSDNSSSNTVEATTSDAKMVILSAGNVGIGNTAPSYKLDVSGDVNTSSVFRVGGVAGWTGTINIPTNPPGQQNIQVSGGIIVNVS